jgi:hypothetical protein
MGASGTHVIVVARVGRVRRLHGGGWRLRLTDTGGTLSAAEIPPASRLGLPRVGARIVIHGWIRYDERHGWHTVDPVDSWVEAPAR